jgi:hypothetical protein
LLLRWVRLREVDSNLRHHLLGIVERIGVVVFGR